MATYWLIATIIVLAVIILYVGIFFLRKKYPGSVKYYPKKSAFYAFIVVGILNFLKWITTIPHGFSDLVYLASAAASIIGGLFGLIMIPKIIKGT